MAEITIKYTDVPRFSVTLESYESDGIAIIDPDKSNPISVVDLQDVVKIPSKGIVGSLNKGPYYKQLQNVSDSQLNQGITYSNIECGDSTILIESMGNCSADRTIDVSNLNGKSKLRLTVSNGNDENATVTSTLKVNPVFPTIPPNPEIISVQQIGIGSTYGEITLGRGTYSFEFDIENTGGDMNNELKTAYLTFIECDGDDVPVVTPPVVVSSNIESISDYQNTILRYKLENGSGIYDTQLLLGTEIIGNFGNVTYGSEYLEIQIPTYFNDIDLRGKELTAVFQKGGNSTTVKYFLPNLVNREYTPNYENNNEDRLLILRLTKTFYNEYKIIDFGDNIGLNPEYFINGGNGGDCDVLPDVNHPTEKQIEILKVLVPSVERWQIGDNYHIAENVFWIQARPWTQMGTNRKGLWETKDAIGKPRMFSDATSFTLPPTKKYNRAFSGKLTGVSDADHDKVSWNYHEEDLPKWLYGFDIIRIITVDLELTQSDGGIQNWPVGGTLVKKFADHLITVLGSKKIVITDWEGPETETPSTSWVWSNHPDAAPNIKWVQDYLREQGKQFFDWFQNIGFTYNDKKYDTVSQQGSFSYVAYKPSNNQQYFHKADDWIDLFENMNMVSLPEVNSGRVGLGYNNVTKYIEDSYIKPNKRRYHAVPHILFAQMVCNWYSLKLPNAKLFSVHWPSEDQLERRNMTTHRFKPSTNLPGYVRGKDIRYVYSQNLYEDFVMYMLLSRNVSLMHVWSTFDQTDPYSSLHYCSKNTNGAPCASYPFVYNYEGDDLYLCPQEIGSYLGMEGQIYEALISQSEIYATKYKDICDGLNNQLDLNNGFSYKREGDLDWTVVQPSNGDEHIQSWKFDQPYLTIWVNKLTNNRVIFFQDHFGKPFGKCEFKFTINGNEVTRTSIGNRAYHESFGLYVTPTLKKPNLASVPTNSTTIQHVWTDTDTVDGFELEFSTNGTTFSLKSNFNGELRQGVTTNHTEGVEYSFRIRAKKGANYSDWSNISKTLPLGGNCEETLTTSQRNLFDNYMNNNLSSGYNNKVVSLLYRNNPLWSYQRDYNNQSIVHVASLSKQFAAVVLLSLVDEGVLTLDTTVGSLIPIMGANGKGNIKLRHLMSHTSGMKAISTQGYEDQSGLTMEEAVNLIAVNVPLEHTPGTYYEYGGVHWCIAARMAEVIKGKSWVEICQEKIWGPLGMTNTAYWESIFPPTANPMIHAGLVTTMSDWSKFMQMRLKKGIFNNTRVLSESMINAMEVDQTGSAIEISGMLTLNPVYGFGLYIDDEHNETYHNSATGCFAWVNRNKGYFGSIFTNVYNGESTTANNTLRTLVLNTIEEEEQCNENQNEEVTHERKVLLHNPVQWDVANLQLKENEINMVVDGGVTHVTLLIDWWKIETALGYFDYTILDKAVKYLKGKGLKSLLQIPFRAPYDGMLNVPPQVNGFQSPFLSNNGIMTLRSGNKATSGIEGAIGCKSSTEYKNRQLRLIANIAHHINTNPEIKSSVKQVLFIDGGSNETGFYTGDHLGNIDDGDYNESTISDFRNFLQRKYGNINKLNGTWGTSFSNFGSIGVNDFRPTLYNYYIGYSENNKTKDWYEFYCTLHKLFYRDVINAVRNPKSVDPSLTTTNTNIQVAAYLTEGLTGQGVFWGSGVINMLSEFDIIFSSRGASDGSHVAGNHLISFAHMMSVLRGCQPNMIFGQEMDKDELTANGKRIGPSRLARTAYAQGAEWIVYVFYDEISEWNEEGYISINGTSLTFLEDAKLAASTYVTGRFRTLPTISQTIRFNLDNVLTQTNNPNNTVTSWVSLVNPDQEGLSTTYVNIQMEEIIKQYTDSPSAMPVTIPLSITPIPTQYGCNCTEYAAGSIFNDWKIEYVGCDGIPRTLESTAGNFKNACMCSHTIIFGGASVSYPSTPTLNCGTLNA